MGYRAQAQGKKLNLSLGFSHPVVYQMPEGVSVETPSQTEILLKGSDKQQVSKNSYIRSRRSVTLQPIGHPSRILNAATDLRAFVTIGFWPAIFVRSSTAPSIAFLSTTDSPTDSKALKKGQGDRSISRVLRNFTAASLPFLFQCFQLGNDGGHHLNNDRC